MAKYDHGGGCPCGLHKYCYCGKYSKEHLQIKYEKINLSKVSTKELKEELQRRK